MALMRTGLMAEDQQIYRPIGAKTDATLAVLLTAIGTTPATVLLTPGIWVISNPLTFPTNVHLKRAPGAILSNAAVPLTINSSQEGPMEPWLQGAGPKVLGPKIPIISPGWFGPIGTADDTVPFQAAIASVPSSGGIVFIPPGTYTITGTLTLTGPIELRGQGGPSTITQMSALPVITVAPASSNLKMVVEHLRLNGGTIGLNFQAPTARYLSRQSSFRNLYLSSQTDAGIQMTNVGHINVSFTDIEVESATNHGVRMVFDGSTVGGVNVSSWRNLRIANTSSDAGAAMHIENTHASADAVWDGYNCTFEGNDGFGLYVHRVVVRLYSAWFEQNGRGTGKPDILWASDTGPITKVILVNTYFSSAHVNQASRRLQFAGPFARLTLIDVRLSSTESLDGGNFASTRVTAIGDSTVPVLNNFAGELAEYLTNTFSLHGPKVIGHLTGTATPLLGTIAAGASTTFTMPIIGIGDTTGQARVTVHPLGSPGSLLQWSWYIESIDSIGVNIHNPTGADIVTIDRTWVANAWLY